MGHSDGGLDLAYDDSCDINDVIDYYRDVARNSRLLTTASSWLLVRNSLENVLFSRAFIKYEFAARSFVAFYLDKQKTRLSANGQ
jgi:hypothetical protein